jgi:hypothetical protein
VNPRFRGKAKRIAHFIKGWRDIMFGRVADEKIEKFALFAGQHFALQLSCSRYVLSLFATGVKQKNKSMNKSGSEKQDQSSVTGAGSRGQRRESR